MSRSSRVLLSLPLLLLPSCQNGFPMESWDIEDKASVPFHFSFRRSLQNPPTSCNTAAEGHNIDTCQDPRNATVIAPFHQTAFAAHEEGAEGRNGRPPKYRKIQQEDFQTISSDNMHQSLFMSALSAHPDRSLSLCWEQHCKLLPGVAGITAATVAKWTIDEVFSFVQTLTGCEDQAKLFKDEMIDGEAFLLLTQADIVKIMSVKLGPALKIYNAILMFKNADDTLK